MCSDDFLFVNPGNSQAAGHKASSSSARAFVMRKARADRAWSTRTLKLADRRRSGNNWQAASKSGESAAGPSAVSAAPAPEQQGKRVAMKVARCRANHSRSVGIVYERRDEDPVMCMLCGRPRSGEPDAVGVCWTCQRPEIASTDLTLAANANLVVPLDPFNSIAVTLGAGSRILLSYFDEIIAPRVAPIGGLLQPGVVQRQWLAPSLTHAAFMHAVLCLTSVQLALVRPDRPEYIMMAIHHRLQAISAVQRNLMDPIAAISDENISAVFNLLCFEENLLLPSFAPLASTHLQADSVQRLAHMRGLAKMIGLRGGLAAMGNARALRSFLLRHSAVQAVASFESPYLLPKGILGKLYSYPDSSIFFLVPFPLTTTCRALGLDVELVEIVKSAECLNQDIGAWMASPSNYPWDALGVQDLYSITIDTCVRWLIEHKSTATSVEGIVCLSLLTYLACLCRTKGSVSSPLQTVLGQLRNYVADQAAWETLRSVKLDIWAALLAVIASESHPEFSLLFFQVYLDILATQATILRTFEDFKAALALGIWKPDPMNTYAQEVWDDTPAQWKGSDGVIRRMVGRRAARTRRVIDAAAALMALNPYTNAHPQAHASIDEGTAYNL